MLRALGDMVVVVACLTACSAEGDSDAPGASGGEAAGSAAGAMGSATTGGGGAGLPEGSGGQAAAGAPPTGSTASGTGGANAGGTGGGAVGGAAGAVGAGGAAGASPAANVACTLLWESGFESGFPGEFGGYDSGSWTPAGDMPAGRVAAWTIIDAASGEPVHSGDHAYRGWIVGTDADSHRAYPGIYENAYQTPLVNTFWVYLDVDYERLGGDWVHFGTWGNDDGAGNGQWALHTMSVRERKLEFAHTEPFLGEYIGPSPQPDFPLGRWVRFTVYVLYEGTTGFVQAWQDGTPVMRADVSQLASYPGTSLITAHWGMYAAAGVDHGTQYNDDIRIWSLAAPLSDLDAEPVCGE